MHAILTTRDIPSSSSFHFSVCFIKLRIAGIQPAHKKKLRMRLAMLNSAQSLDDVDISGWRLHSLPGKLQGRWAISVSGNWRLTFENDGDKFSILDYEDYH